MFRGSPFDRGFRDLFHEIEQEFEAMERRFEELRDQARTRGGGGGEPLVYGWSMRVGPDGRPQVRTFGNLAESNEALEAGWREPFVTSFVDEAQGLLRLTAELPGVTKDAIDVRALDEAVRIQAEGEDRKYRAQVPVERPLKPDTARANYNNGILEVTVELAEEEASDGHQIEIE